MSIDFVIRSDCGPEHQPAAGPNPDRRGLNSPSSFRGAESEQSGLSSTRCAQHDESGLWLEGDFERSHPTSRVVAQKVNRPE